MSEIFQLMLLPEQGKVVDVIPYKVELRKYPAMQRTISYADEDCREEKTTLAFLSFPPITIAALTNQQDKRECPTVYFLIEAGKDVYCPFPMFNVNADGILCLGTDYEVGTDVFHYVWNSTFSAFSTLLCIYVNMSLYINSLSRWIDLTRQNPNFMKEQFNVPLFRIASTRTIQISKSGLIVKKKLYGSPW